MGKVKKAIMAALLIPTVVYGANTASAEDRKAEDQTIVEETGCTETKAKTIERTLGGYIDVAAKNKSGDNYGTFRDIMLDIANIDYWGKITDLENRFSVKKEKQEQYLDALNEVLGKCKLELQVDTAKDASGIERVIGLDLMKRVDINTNNGEMRIFYGIIRDAKNKI